MILLAAIAVDTLVPVEWQIRLGLHWLIEHFLAYFAVTFDRLPRLAAADGSGGLARGPARCCWRRCKG